MKRNNRQNFVVVPSRKSENCLKSHENQIKKILFLKSDEKTTVYGKEKREKNWNFMRNLISLTFETLDITGKC